MKKDSAKKQPKKSQHDLFKETAKDHGCDEKFDLKPEWDRLGLEKTWRYFLPLIVIVGLWVLYYLSFWTAGITLAITGVWLWRSRK